MDESKSYALDITKPSRSLKELIEDSLKKLGAPLLKTETGYADKIGLYITVTLQCSARQALELWIKILDNVQEYGIPIFVEWTGELDVAPDEMGQYIGKAFAKMGLFLVTEKPLDIAKIIEEE